MASMNTRSSKRSFKWHLRTLCNILVVLSMVLSPFAHASILSLWEMNTSEESLHSHTKHASIQSDTAPNCHQALSSRVIQDEMVIEESMQSMHGHHVIDSTASDACKSFCTSSVGTLVTLSALFNSQMQHFASTRFLLSDYIPIDFAPLLRPPIA